MPTVPVPTGTLESANVANPGDTSGLGPLCSEVGSFQQFTQAQLHTLYPTHARYVLRVALQALRLLRNRFLAPDDAVRLVRQAAQSNIGKN